MTAARSRSRASLTAALLAGALLAGCGTSVGGPALSSPTSSSKASVTATDAPSSTVTAVPLAAGTLPTGDPKAPMPAPNTCHVGSKNGQDIPDARCTPGATNPAVTPATIGSTICKSGWTDTVRPPTSVTSKMKKLSAASYGLPAGAESEYDHLVSLQLGGAVDDPRNLWVEPGKVPNDKDAVETNLKKAVCSDLVPLASAQQAIAVSWPTAYDDAGLRVAGGKVCLRDNPARCVK